VAVRLPHSPTTERLEFRLVTASHRTLAQKTAVIGPSTPEGQSIELEVGNSTRPREPIYLEVRTESGTSARFPTSLELTASPA
jgi:hypothetical protein